RHTDIEFIENHTTHNIPLRLVGNALKKRKQNIQKSAVRKLKAYIKKEGKPDAIFHHGIFDFCYLSKHLSEIFDLPIWYMENSPNLTPERFPCANPFDTMEDQKAFVANADRRIAVTDAYVEKMTELFGLPFEKCPNVITDEFFVQPDSVSRPTDYFQFVNVAILDRRKNQSLILKAFAENYRDNLFYRLKIAGDGPLYDPLNKLARDLKIEKQVEILGFQNRDEILQLLDQSHCFVLSSHSETFGVVVIEAMARGIPAISSDIDGTNEILTPENGILFEPDNLSGLAKAMVDLVENYNSLKPETIVKSVQQRFGPDAVKKALFENG
ncbi:MAG TPA: glycosyltransferase, partial [Cryomorphaceae bacterium]|nr:glycosyltransferase [Cryomorphaceae bacterium]